jgi:hypothetical protein
MSVEAVDEERLRALAFFAECRKRYSEDLTNAAIRFLEGKRGRRADARIEQDADDDVAEAFLKMIRNVDEGRPMLLGHLRDFGFSVEHPGVIRYLSVVCKNTAVDRHRHENRGGKLAPPEDTAGADQFWGMVARMDMAVLEAADRDEDDPESVFLRAESAEVARRELQEALWIFEEKRHFGQIRNATWRVYELVWKEEKSHDEAAAILARSKKVVQNQDAIIKKILRRIINDLRHEIGSNAHDE